MCDGGKFYEPPRLQRIEAAKRRNENRVTPELLGRGAAEGIRPCQQSAATKIQKVMKLEPVQGEEFVNVAEIGGIPVDRRQLDLRVHYQDVGKHRFRPFEY